MTSEDLYNCNGVQSLVVLAGVGFGPLWFLQLCRVSLTVSGLRALGVGLGCRVAVEGLGFKVRVTV